MFRLTHTLTLAAAALLATATTVRAEVVLNAGGNLTFFSPKDNGKHFALHSVFLEAGKQYRIQMFSNDFDTYLELKNFLGIVVARNDDGGPKLNSRIEFTPLFSGLFRVVATTFKTNAVGGYKIRVTGLDGIVPPPLPPLPVPPLPVPPNVVLNVHGNLAHADPVKNGKHFDAYKLFLKAGNDYVINMESAHFDTYLRVTNQAGVVLAQNDDGGMGRNSRIVFRPMANGFYNIVATSYKNDAIGGYDLRVVRNGGIVPPPLPIPPKVILNVHGDLKFADPVKNGKHYHTYKVGLKAGREYVINMTSDHFDTYLRVTNQVGVVLVQNDDGGMGRNSRIVFRPLTNGFYNIVATSYANGATGHFHLNVRD